MFAITTYQLAVSSWLYLGANMIIFFPNMSSPLFFICPNHFFSEVCAVHVLKCLIGVIQIVQLLS